MCLGISQGWAGHDKHDGKVTIALGTGKGKVYITDEAGNSNPKEMTWDCGKNEGNEYHKKKFQLHAEPDQNDPLYQFTSWSKSDNMTFADAPNPDNDGWVELEAHVTTSVKSEPDTYNYTANFTKLNKFKATLNVVAIGEGGNVTVDGNASQTKEDPEYSTNPKGTFDFTCVATVTDGYELMGWAETDPRIDPNVTLTKRGVTSYTTQVVAEDDKDPDKHEYSATKTVYAVFKKKIDYSATVNVVKVGEGNVTATVSGNGKQEFSTGDDTYRFTFNLKAAGNNDYDFKGWAASENDANNGTYITTSTSYTVFADCTKDKPEADTQTLYAVFKQIKTHYSKVVLKAVGNGGVYVTGSSNTNTTAANTSSNYKQTVQLEQESKSSDDEVSHSYGKLALANAGYVFDGWYDESTDELVDNNNSTSKFTVTTTSTDNTAPKVVTYYAKFVSVEDYVKNKINKENYSEELAGAIWDILKGSDAVTEAQKALPTNWRGQLTNPWTNQNSRKSGLDALTFVGLNETAKNNSNVNKKKYDAVAVKRTLLSGRWNTFCVPFEMPKSELGAGAKVKFLESVKLEGTKYTLKFVDEEGDNIHANKPYIVQVPNDKGIVGVAGATIVDGTPVTTADYGVSFVGTYDHIDKVPQGNYIISNNMFYLVNSEVYLDGFRGYFIIPGAEALSSTFDDEDVTGISFVNDDNNDDNYYNVAGQRVKANAKGIIIKNGKKYFVK